MTESVMALAPWITVTETCARALFWAIALVGTTEEAVAIAANAMPMNDLWINAARGPIVSFRQVLSRLSAFGGGVLRVSAALWQRRDRWSRPATWRYPGAAASCGSGRESASFSARYPERTRGSTGPEVAFVTQVRMELARSVRTNPLGRGIRMRRLFKLPVAACAAAVLIVGLAAQPAAAQFTANASAAVSATIVGVAPLTATTVNDLNFGSVTAGTPTTVAEIDGARFLMTGEPSFPVNVSFALPGTLLGPGAATIPITFSTTDGLLWAPFPTTFTTFNPNAVFSTSMDGTGALEIGIRGTVSPPALTVSGIYTGTITITVAY